MTHDKRTPPNGGPKTNGIAASWGQFRKFMEEDNTPVPNDPESAAIYAAGYTAGVKAGLDLMRKLWDIVKNDYHELALKADEKRGQA